MSLVAFSAATATVGVFILLWSGVFLAAWLRGVLWRRRAAASAALLPRIREAVVEYLAGSNDTSRLRAFLRQSRRDVADGILEFRNAAGGEARDRLCALALDLALVHEWVEDAQTRDVIRRRTAFARLSFACAYEPCRRVAGELLVPGLNDADQESCWPPPGPLCSRAIWPLSNASSTSR